MAQPPTSLVYQPFFLNGLRLARANGLTDFPHGYGTDPLAGRQETWQTQRKRQGSKDFQRSWGAFLRNSGLQNFQNSLGPAKLCKTLGAIWSLHIFPNAKPLGASSSFPTWSKKNLKSAALIREFQFLRFRRWGSQFREFYGVNFIIVGNLVMNNGPIIEKNGSVGLFHEVIYGLWMFVVDTSLVYWGCHLAVDKPHWC